MYERGERLLDLVHADVCGPFLSASKDGKRYYVTFTNDFSRYGYVYLSKHKLNTFEVFKRGVFLEREMISKEDSWSKIDLEEIQESADEEPIVNTDTKQKDKISDSTLSKLDEPASYKEAMASPENPSEGHWTAIKNILKYLRNTKDGFLVYGGEEELRVTGYCNASWQTDKDDSRLHFGWVFLLNGGAVT
nr:retrotransposon protein, putative, Ty1-copia subclass [Tanacetum cinerariifolium]